MATVFSMGRVIAVALALAFGLAGCGGDNPEALLASARDYLAKNDPKAAVIQLKNALQKNPEMSEVRLLLGQALLRTGDAVGAETELRKALALKHSAELVVPSLAQAMLAQRQYKKVTDDFSATTLTQPAAVASLKTSLAFAYAAQRKSEFAREALKAAIAADQTYGPAMAMLARQKAQDKDFAGALSIVESIIATTPGDADAWTLKGDILLLGLKRRDEGVAAYRKSVEVKPDYSAGHATLLQIFIADRQFEDAAKQLEALKKIAPTSFATTYFDTLLAYHKKDLKRARQLAQQLVREAPKAAPILQLSGVIELELNALPQAEVFLDRALQAGPEAMHTRRLLATVYLRAGQTARALAVIQPMLKDANLSASSNSLIGEVYLQNGDVKRAEEYLTKAIKQDPKNETARTSLALTSLAGGREQAGFAELEDIAATETGTTAALALVSAHLRRAEYDRALKAIDGLEAKRPGTAALADLRGRTLLAKRDFAGARKSFERSIGIDPTFFASIASLATLDMADNKPSDARKRFDDLLAKDPKNSEALLAIAELRAQSGASKEEVAELLARAVTATPTEVRPRLLLVEHHLRFKDFKQAVTVAQDGVSAISESAELLEVLGRAQLGSGDINQAIAAYNKLAVLQPLSPRPYMLIAEAHLAAKDKAAAAQSLQKAIAIKPDLFQAHRELITIALANRNYDEAIRIARTMQNQAPKDPTGYQFEGDIAVQRKKWDAAIDAYRSGLKVAPTSVLAIKLHNVLVAAGKSADADKLSATWTKDYPKDTAYRVYLGDAALARGDFSGAEGHYASVLKVQPSNAVTLNNLAWVTNKLGKDGALGYAEKAMALMPNQPSFMDTVAGIYSDKSDYKNALEWQTKALGLAPQNPNFRLNLAKIHIRGGKKDLARKELDELAKLGTKFGAHAEVATLLKGL